jgi:hypothetical protein
MFEPTPVKPGTCFDADVTPGNRKAEAEER